MNTYIHTFLLVLFCFALLPSIGTAQQNNDSQNNRQTSSFNLEFNSELNSYYYQDPLSTNLNYETIVSDGSLDPDTYILGPNDVITVDINASQKLLFRALFINSQGDVVLPVFGSISLEGKSISEAKQIFTDKTLETFQNASVNITLDRAKPLLYYIQGNVSSPGRHLAPPFSRVDRAIFNSVTGNTQTPPENTIELLSSSNLSLRNIIITHQNGSVTNADLVAYFRAGKLEMNPVIQKGDRIKINNLDSETPRVSISGAVQNPTEIEYSRGDTPQLLLDIAGSFTPDADTTKLQVLRNASGDTERVEVSKSQWDTFKIEPNDRLIVTQRNEEFNNASARVYGEVEIPGIFPVISGETTALELLNTTGGLTERALPAAAYLIRAGSVENEVPNKFNVELMKRTSDQLIQGFEYLELENQLSRNRVHIDLRDDQHLKRVKLFDGDRLYVPRDENTIFVFGQVNNPGYFPFESEVISVKKYIDRAGGFALAADQKRVFIIKAGSKTWYQPGDTSLNSGDMIFVDREPYDELNAMRSYQVQREQVKNTRIQLVMTAVTTITSIVTTLVAIDVIRR